MQAFQEALSDCDLEDLGYVGDKFTWFRGGLKERLDRAVMNGGWMNMHPYAGLCNSDMGKSDHRPIMLDTEYLAGVAEAKPQYKRRFEARWLEEK